MDPRLMIAAYIASVAIDRGVPAVENLIKNWKTVDPTLSDWEKLKSIPLDPRKELG
jgi:hypothetical protein